MKYKIFISIVLFGFISNVNAITYYGNYRKVEEIGNYSNDTLLIDNYKLYNTYNIKYKDLGYMLDNDLYIKDENDYIEELIEEDNIEGDEYIELYYNKEIIDKFLLYLPLDIEINEIEVYHQDEKIEYSVFNPPMFGTGNIENLYDNDYNTIYKHTFKSRMALWIPESNINDIKIIVYTKKGINYDFDISFENGKKNISFNNNIDRRHIIEPHYSEQDNIIYKYKTMKKLYRYFKEEKEILNNYIKEGNNILLDDYIETNDTYIRDKLTLKDNLVIDKLNYNLNDFILEKTDNVLINCIINYEVNDTYKCNFILNDINVEKEVILNIPRTIQDNNEEVVLETTKENEDKILEIIEEKETNNNSINDVETMNYELLYIGNKKQKIKEKNIKDIENKVEKKEIKPKKIEKKLNKKNANEKEVRKSNILNIVKYIILFNLVIIEIILFIRKRKRNNVERV